MTETTDPAERIRSLLPVTPRETEGSGSARSELEQLNDPLGPLKTEKGWLGIILGARSEKSGNIAGAVVIFGLFMMCAIFFSDRPMPPEGQVYSLTAKDAIATLASLMTAALGYLFGRNSRSD